MIHKMKRSTPSPPITPELLDWLSETYPDRIPTTPISEKELAKLVGQQSVIRRLRKEFERQLHQ